MQDCARRTDVIGDVLENNQYKHLNEEHNMWAIPENAEKLKGERIETGEYIKKDK